MFTFRLFAATVEHVHRPLDILFGEDDADTAIAQNLARPLSGAGRQQNKAVVQDIGQLLPSGFTAAGIRCLPGFQEAGQSILPGSINEDGFGLAEVEIDLEDLIQEEEVAVTITSDGYITSLQSAIDAAHL